MKMENYVNFIDNVPQFWKKRSIEQTDLYRILKVFK